MLHDPQAFIQNVSIPNFGPRRRFCHSQMRRSYLFRCPSLLCSVYTSTFFPRLCSAVLCKFGTDPAGRREALPRNTTPRQVLYVLVRRKSEECHAEKICNSVCR